jgi:hypothetical protein
MDPLLIIHGPNSPNKNRIDPSLSTSSSILRTTEPNSIGEIPQKNCFVKKERIYHKFDNTIVHMSRLVALLGHLH